MATPTSYTESEIQSALWRKRQEIESEIDALRRKRELEYTELEVLLRSTGGAGVEEGAGRLRERERENVDAFAGVFAPRFLPLLDAFRGEAEREAERDRDERPTTPKSPLASSLKSWEGSSGGTGGRKSPKKVTFAFEDPEAVPSRSSPPPARVVWSVAPLEDIHFSDSDSEHDAGEDVDIDADLDDADSDDDAQHIEHITPPLPTITTNLSPPSSPTMSVSSDDALFDLDEQLTTLPAPVYTPPPPRTPTPPLQPPRFMHPASYTHRPSSLSSSFFHTPLHTIPASLPSAPFPALTFRRRSLAKYIPSPPPDSAPSSPPAAPTSKSPPSSPLLAASVPIKISPPPPTRGFLPHQQTPPQHSALSSSLQQERLTNPGSLSVQRGFGNTGGSLQAGFGTNGTYKTRFALEVAEEAMRGGGGGETYVGGMDGGTGGDPGSVLAHAGSFVLGTGGFSFSRRLEEEEAQKREGGE